MIDHATIDRILEAAPIEQVIGEYVSLKRRGANFIACCPFHNEKTPSFSVSPSKGIFKCFGCGKAGNVVGFIMEHEQLPYVEALKFLANKYHIPIDDQPETPEEAQNRMRRDSMLIVNDFAQKYYTQYLWEHPMGQSIGLGYFRERGFTDASIKQFQLGYAPNARNALTQAALNAGYKLEFLTATGLTLHYDGKPESSIDRYQDRVIFPIHSLSGRIIAFGGRTLRTDKQPAKYINSPESEVYSKSRSLYGIYFAKQHITRQQKCYLVEGYTDVISFVQAGIQNVVASSGTSLTTEQIRLIKRFTPLVTVLYDGDNAGIKASIRGIDMLLEEGLQVKVVRFPDGDDPDSFARTHSAKETLDFLDSHETDFIRFKMALMAEDMADPLRRSQLIRDVMTSIAIIPDAITRSIYVEECSRSLDIDEKLLTTEVTRLRKKSLEHRFAANSMARAEARSAGTDRLEQVPPPVDEAAPATEEPLIPGAPAAPASATKEDDAPQELLQAERDILYYLIKFGQSPFEDSTVAHYIKASLRQDDLQLSHPFLQTLFQLYFTLEGDNSARRNDLVNHHNPEVATFVLNLLGTPHPLLVKSLVDSLPVEEAYITQYVTKSLLVYKLLIVTRACNHLTREIQRAQLLSDAPKVEAKIKELQHLTAVRKSFAKELKRLN